MATITKEKIGMALMLIRVVAEAVKESGSMGAPEGPIYAAMTGRVTLDGFNELVGLLVKSGLIEKRGNVLHWIGPNE